jgi:hypothetical protein
VFAHLDQILSALDRPDNSLVLAVSGWRERQQLALLLGILERLSVAVVGLVDMACVATRFSAPGAQLFHLDADLHRTVITPLLQERQLRAGEPKVVERAGVLAAERAMTRAVAAEFVRQCRFDPLHQGTGEQQIHDRLPRILQELQTAGVVELVMEAGGAERRIELGQQVLVRALAGQLDLMANAMADLVRSGQDAVLQISHRLARMPGLLDRLAGLGQVEVLERGTVAQGALAWLDSQPPGATQLSFVRSVDLPPPRAGFAVNAGVNRPVSSAAIPTHLLVGDTAYIINQKSLEIGRDPPVGARCVRMADDAPGVSRRHCSISSQDNVVTLRDHSQFGTWLNERRVASATQLRVGDQLRLGDAGQILRLIRVSEQ